MAIQNQIERIEAARNDIRNKLVELALVESSAKIDELAAAVKGIQNRGDVDVEVQEGQTFTIPAGYHNGSGTVKGVAGGGNYTLQAKSVVPTKEQQSVTPDEGKYGLSSVTVGAIPEAYQDVTSVTAGAADVLTGKVIVDATGKVVAGSMPNNGAVSETLTMLADEQSYTIPKGFHDGTGKVQLIPEGKEATPSKTAQQITASPGKVLSDVKIAPIPDEYQDITVVTATANEVREGWQFVDATGAVVNGTMTDHGVFHKTLDTKGGNHTYTIPEGYHCGDSTVKISVEVKEVEPTKSTQNITPTDGKVIGGVTVKPIPDAYQDVTGVTATADKVLTGSKFVDAAGTVVDGAMPIHNNVDEELCIVDDKYHSYTIPAGYHDGTGKVSINVEAQRGVTPTKSTQIITPNDGNVLSSVKVNPIPDAYQDVTDVTATASAVLEGHDFVNSTGAVVEGAMINRGKVTQTIDGLATTSYTIPQGYHDGTGTISLTNDIETLLAAI